MAKVVADSLGRSDHAVRQDEAWLELVSELRAESEPDFAAHWARFQEIYRDRAPADGPPLAWQPSSDVVDRSNVDQFAHDNGLSDYSDLHRWSVSERESFWRRAIDRLGIVFSERPRTTLDLTDGPAHPRWLVGARLNAVDSCFKADRASPAIIAGGEGGEGYEGSAELRTVTRDELERLVNRVANGLDEHGFEKGASIALYMPMTIDCVAAYLGIIRAGLRVVSVADSFSPGEVAKRLQIVGTDCVLTVASFTRAGKTIAMYDKVKEAGVERAIVIPGTTAVDLRDRDIDWNALLSDTQTFTSVVGDPYDTTNVLFSSGTTGTPKAIPWNHLTPIKCAMDGHFHQDIQRGDVVAWPTNIGWMMGPWLIYASLINDAAMVLYEGAPTGPGFTAFVRESGVTMLGVVPALVRAWRASGSPAFDEWSGVRAFSSTGEPSNREDYLWLMGRAGYRAPIIEYLGGTEIGGGHMTGTVVQPASPAAFSTPALGIALHILDDRGKAVAAGQAGQMYLEPPAIGLSQSLLDRDHDEVYYDGCPSGPNGEVLRRHGDEMERGHQGFYRAQGRADDTMNLGGIKVSSLELERVLNRPDEVYESAAVAVQPTGEGAEQLVVFVVVAGQPDVDELERTLGKRLARELNPLIKIYDIRVVDKLPRTASNKIMRRKLRAAYRAETR